MTGVNQPVTMIKDLSGARCSTTAEFISRAVGDVIKAVLTHLSKENADGGVRVGHAVRFLDDHSPVALDAAFTFSPDEIISSSWGRYLHLTQPERLHVLMRAREELAAIPDESFVAHEYIAVLITRASSTPT